MHSSSLLPDASTMYAALVRRDATYEGVFWAAVRTTGIVRRPT
jgi:AraC family transcriptional regulator of adaptative response/methylated-DNA-[protein]-cysteine methyltransferase